MGCGFGLWVVQGFITLRIGIDMSAYIVVVTKNTVRGVLKGKIFEKIAGEDVLVGKFSRKADGRFRNMIVPEMRTVGAMYRFDTFCGGLSRNEVLSILVDNAENQSHRP